MKFESTKFLYRLQKRPRLLSRITVHGKNVDIDRIMEFKQIPHRQGHDHDENGRHDKEDRHGMDVPDDQQEFLFQGIAYLNHS